MQICLPWAVTRAAVVVACLVVSGCGGGNSPAPSVPIVSLDPVAPVVPVVPVVPIDPPAPPVPVVPVVPVVPIDPPGISLLAGALGGLGDMDGLGSEARFANLGTLVADGSTDNLLVTSGDYRTAFNVHYRKITAQGLVSTFESLNADPVNVFPTLTVAPDGNYLATTKDSRLGSLSPSGAFNWIAGEANPTSENRFRDGPVATARFNTIYGLASSASGDIYVADMYNHAIRKVSKEGMVTTLAGGKLYAQETMDGVGGEAVIAYPRALAVTKTGDVFVLEQYGNCVRRVSPSGVVTTIQLEEACIRKTSDAIVHGTAVSGITAAPDGAVLVSRGNSVFQIDQSGKVAIFAGVPDVTLGALAVTQGGAVFAATAQGTVVQVNVGNTYHFKTLAGLAAQAGSTDGQGGAARFNNPADTLLDASGALFVSDCGSGTIRRVSASGAVSTYAGLAGDKRVVDGVNGLARFYCPLKLAMDSLGNLLVVDSGQVRKITPGGVVTTLALPLEGTFGVAALAVDGADNIFVALGGCTPWESAAEAPCFQRYQHAIFKVAPSGAVLQYWGAPYGSRGMVDGTPDVARFFNIKALLPVAGSNLLIADQGNCAIRKIAPNGDVSTWMTFFDRSLKVPFGVPVCTIDFASLKTDSKGNLYATEFNLGFADRGPQRAVVWKISADGSMQVVAGQLGGRYGVRLGPLPGNLNAPSGLSVAPDGTLFVLDENAVLRIRP